MAPSGGETALDQSESAPHFSDNRDFNNKRTTNQNAPFQISTNQNETNCSSFLGLQNCTHTTYVICDVLPDFVNTSYVVETGLGDRIHLFLHNKIECMNVDEPPTCHD